MQTMILKPDVKFLWTEKQDCFQETSSLSMSLNPEVNFCQPWTRNYKFRKLSTVSVFEPGSKLLWPLSIRIAYAETLLRLVNVCQSSTQKYCYVLQTSVNQVRRSIMSCKRLSIEYADILLCLVSVCHLFTRLFQCLKHLVRDYLKI